MATPITAETIDLLAACGAALVIAALVGSALVLAQAALTRAFLLRPALPPLAARPGVSLLRPLAGHDDDLEALLRDAAAALGPDDELLLGVASARDPARPAAERIAAGDPQRVRVVLTDKDAALNPKVAQLIGMTAAARRPILAVSDANVALPAGYLDDIAARLALPGVGLVTHPVCGVGARTLGAWLDVLHLGCGIGAGVVGAKRLAGQDIVVGKSMALRRETLAALGGWRSLGGVLAEDFVCGRRVRDELGLGVSLSTLCVTQLSRDRSVRGFYDRFGRWATMQRFAVGMPLYAAQALLSPVALALLALACKPTAAAGSALAVAASARLVADVISARALGGALPRPPALALLPLRDVAVLACWLRGLVVGTVTWRGHRLRMRPGTVLEPIHAASWRRPRPAPTALVEET